MSTCIVRLPEHRVVQRRLSFLNDTVVERGRYSFPRVVKSQPKYQKPGVVDNHFLNLVMADLSATEHTNVRRVNDGKMVYIAAEGKTQNHNVSLKFESLGNYRYRQIFPTSK